VLFSTQLSQIPAHVLSAGDCISFDYRSRRRIVIRTIFYSVGKVDLPIRLHLSTSVMTMQKHRQVPPNQELVEEDVSQSSGIPHQPARSNPT